MALSLGLVLSGGIAKGAYQIGFLKALSENKSFDVTAVSAASIGTLNSYAFCTGKLALAEDIWRSVSGCSVSELYLKYLKGKEIYSLVDMIRADDDVISAPLYTVCWIPPQPRARYYLINEKPIGNIREYLKASVTVAPIMEPLTINGKCHFDGAIIDNVPLLPLKHYRPDLIISLQFDRFDYAYRSFTPPCPVLYVDLQDGHRIMDSFSLGGNAVDRMISYGYEVGDYTLTLIEKRVDDRERLHLLIDMMNCGQKKNRLSGDMVVRKINRICQKLK